MHSNYTLLWIGLASWLWAPMTEVRAQSHTSWKMASHPKIVLFSKVLPEHGHAEAFRVAPAIPAWPSADWRDAPHPRDINFTKKSRHCGTTHLCLQAGDYNFYRTVVHFPKGFALNSLKLRIWALDDGVIATITNSKYPQGVTPAESRLSLLDSLTAGPMAGSATTPELASYFAVGEPNVLVLTHEDDCCSAMVLQRAELLVNGKTAARNDAPRLRSLPVTYARPGVLYRYPIEAQDPESESLSLRVVKAPAGAQWDASQWRLTWTPAASQLGSRHSFQVEICDPKNACVGQRWEVQVQRESSNQAPKIASQPPLLIRYDRSYAYELKVEDPNVWDRAWHRYRLVQAPAGAAIDARSGRLTWQPKASQIGTLEGFAVEVCDFEKACVQQSWKVRVRGLVAPTFGSYAPRSALVGQTYTYKPRLWMPEKDVIYTWTFLQGPNLYFQGTTGALRWSALASQRGQQVSFGLRVCDPLGQCAEQRWDVVVRQASDLFWVSSAPGLFAVAGQPYVYAPAIYPSDTFSLSLLSAPSGAQVSKGQLLWTPSAAMIGQNVQVHIRCCLSQSLCRSQSWEIRVIGRNLAPKWRSTPEQQSAEGQVYRYDMKAVDPDKGQVYFRLRKAPQGVELDHWSGALAWKIPKGAGAKSHAFEAEVCDFKGLCEVQQWQLRVLATVALGCASSSDCGAGYTCDMGVCKALTSPTAPAGAKPPSRSLPYPGPAQPRGVPGVKEQGASQPSPAQKQVGQEHQTPGPGPAQGAVACGCSQGHDAKPPGALALLALLALLGVFRRP